MGLYSVFTHFPGPFELFYVERMNDIGARQATAKMIYAFTDKIIDADILKMKDDLSIDELKADTIKLSLKIASPVCFCFTITGFSQIIIRNS